MNSQGFSLRCTPLASDPSGPSHTSRRVGFPAPAFSPMISKAQIPLQDKTDLQAAPSTRGRMAVGSLNQSPRDRQHYGGKAPRRQEKPLVRHLDVACAVLRKKSSMTSVSRWIRDASHCARAKNAARGVDEVTVVPQGERPARPGSGSPLRIAPACEPVWSTACGRCHLPQAASSGSFKT
jgi:hypothetical protein